MIPHQIYCDYLEDKGIDTRLLRTQELEGITMSGYKDLYNFCYYTSYYHLYNETLSEDGNGWGDGYAGGGGGCAIPTSQYRNGYYGDTDGDGYHKIRLEFGHGDAT